MLTYEQIEGRRVSFEKRYRGKVLKALGAQYAQAVAALRDGIATPEVFITQGSVSEVLLELHVACGSQFSRLHFRDLKQQNSKRESAKRESAKDEATDNNPVWFERMRRFFISTITPRIEKITDNTKRVVADAVAQGKRLGWALGRIADFLEKNWKKVSRSRAFMIARTETVAAAHRGTLHAAEGFSVLFPGKAVSKIWIARFDERTRHSHAAASGQEVAVAQPFRVGSALMQHPGDPAGGAKETVNCRCAMRLVLK